MVQRLKFYIDGAWQDPVSKKTLPVINPANEEPLYEIALGSKADVDNAVAAARRAFETFSLTTRDERADLLAKIIDVYKKRMKEIGAAISDEMGAPLTFAERFQAGAGLGHLMTTLDVLKSYPFEERARHRHARARAGRRLRPDHALELAPQPDRLQGRAGAGGRLHDGAEAVRVRALNSALIFAEILHEAGVPAGVFNLVNGDGPRSAPPCATHPGIDMMSFTGSTRAGIEVAAARRRPSSASRQELGGKSPNIILDDADLAEGHHRRHRTLLQQLGPVLQRADPHAGAAGAHDGSGRHRQGRGRRDQGRRSAEPPTPPSARSSARCSGTRSRA